MDFYIAESMLQVLDQPTSIRIIAKTKCPLLGGNDEIGDDKIYFMVDYGHPAIEDGDEGVVYGDWRVSDNAGNEQVFRTNADLIAFFEDNEEIFDDVYIECF